MICHLICQDPLKNEVRGLFSPFVKLPFLACLVVFTCNAVQYTTTFYWIRPIAPVLPRGDGDKLMLSVLRHILSMLSKLAIFVYAIRIRIRLGGACFYIGYRVFMTLVKWVWSRD